MIHLPESSTESVSRYWKGMGEWLGAGFAVRFDVLEGRRVEILQQSALELGVGMRMDRR